jgi:S1-C subfamily serine protease
VVERKALCGFVHGPSVRLGRASPFDRFSSGISIAKLLGMSEAKDFSGHWLDAAGAADAALVHVSAPCRRGATGSLYGTDGVVLTTARAVAGRERLEVVQGEHESAAQIVGYDAATDLGVARLDHPFGAPPPWTDAPVRLGQLLLAGTRPGRAPRVRLGLVSQVGDAWHSLRGGRVERYVETDVAPEPGFSGGLAFDGRGRALGMLSAGLLRGVPLLLEKPTLERVVSAILQHGRVRRGYLGVGTQAVRLSPEVSGLLVSSVQPGSAAERAGLLVGDVLLGLGATALKDAGALQAALEDAEGQALPLELLRGGQKQSVEVTPGVRS